MSVRRWMAAGCCIAASLALLWAYSNTDSTDVIIRLRNRAEIRHVEIENRRSEQFIDRAEGLAMWTSDDGESWREVWRSEKPAAKWSFDLPAGSDAKFVKLALTQPGIFHLNQVVMYGRTIENPK